VPFNRIEFPLSATAFCESGQAPDQTLKMCFFSDKIAMKSVGKICQRPPIRWLFANF
jgi:hypothetical protein